MASAIFSRMEDLEFTFSHIFELAFVFIHLSSRRFSIFSYEPLSLFILLIAWWSSFYGVINYDWIDTPFASSGRQ